MTSITFIDKQFDWRQTSLHQFCYECNNVPYAYRKFFDQSDVKAIVQTISDELRQEAANDIPIYPRLEDVFRAFSCSNPKVVIIGMDPYPNPSETDPWIPGSATGLCFSLSNGEYINPSMQSIQKELRDEGFSVDEKSGNLSRWVGEGVLLLNSALTVREKCPGKHIKIWAPFTKKLVEYLSTEYDLIWILWGAPAQGIEKHILRLDRQQIVKSSHPCPLSCRKPCGQSPPFMKSNCFNQVNKMLIGSGKDSINWNIP